MGTAARTRRVDRFSGRRRSHVGMHSLYEAHLPFRVISLRHGFTPAPRDMGFQPMRATRRLGEHAIWSILSFYAWAESPCHAEMIQF